MAPWPISPPIFRAGPLILVSKLAWHTQNLLADARASVLVGELPPTGDALVGPRVTVLGRFEPVEDANLRRRYLARHPQAGLYADFPDFSFWRLNPSGIHGVAGFGRIETLTPRWRCFHPPKKWQHWRIRPSST